MLEKKMEKIFQDSDELFRFASRAGDNSKVPKDYGDGRMVTMSEAHTLDSIYRNPGITNTELAVDWRKTKSAISQMVHRLVTKGLVEERKTDGNKKNVRLYVTPEGERLCEKHYLYDVIRMTEIRDELRKTCTEEEIESFFKVVREWRRKIQ